MTDEEAMEQARHLVEQEAYEAAEVTLQPLLAREVPNALYLYACFGLPNESDEQFEIRRFWYLHQAARLAHPEALYSLAVMHDCGDQAVKSSEMASCYFQLAAHAGKAEAKLSYGLDLFYGTNGILPDEGRGLELVREACDAGVEGALGALEGMLSAQKLD
jgi:TPR repeat protein